MNLNEQHLTVKNISVTFSRWGQNVEALKDVSISISQGQWVLVIGPNGAGKTTFLKVLSGRMTPSNGEVMVNGKTLRSMGRLEIAANIFHVHQDPLLGTAPGLTVFENLIVADHEAQRTKELHGRLKKKYLPMLERVGLQKMLKQLVRDLSGGERQLLTLIVVSLRPARIVILDEPFAALDPDRTRVCIEEISRLNSEGRTIIQVTHDMDFVNGHGNRVVAFKEGRIIHDELLDIGSPKVINDMWQTLSTRNGERWIKLNSKG